VTRTQGEAAAVLPVVLGMAAVVVVANRWGQALLDDGVGLRILAPPLIGRFRLGPPGGLLPLVPAVAVGFLLIVRLPRLCRELAWSRLLILSVAAAAAFAIVASSPTIFTTAGSDAFVPAASTRATYALPKIGRSGLVKSVVAAAASLSPSTART